MHNYSLSHLRELESEAIFVMRKVQAQFENQYFCSLEEKIQLF